MKTLFSDPVHWSASAVGTQARFALVFVLLSAMTGFTVFATAHAGMRFGAAVALFVISMQFLLLYALRAMVLRGDGQSADGRDAARPASAPASAVQAAP